ncbi:MAG: hypothetical protein M0T81_01660 [Thermoplasmatales archaeon]|nr:hypothetical protein [Thermoplasmatales archaeon]
MLKGTKPRVPVGITQAFKNYLSPFNVLTMPYAYKVRTSEERLTLIDRIVIVH